jgi:hypothetical protein
VLYAGVLPPFSPGRLGIFHTLIILGLEALNTDRALGLAYATVLHAIVYVPEILPGALLLGLRLAVGKRQSPGGMFHLPGDRRSHDDLCSPASRRPPVARGRQ